MDRRKYAIAHAILFVCERRDKGEGLCAVHAEKKSIPMYKDFKKYLENRYTIKIQASYVLMNTDITYTDWYPYTPLFM
jgi:hypothetical protein